MLQPLGIERHADTIVPDDLDQIAADTPEHIEIAGMRVAAESLLYLQRQTVHAFPRDCQEFRARLSGLTDQSMAAVKRSPKRTANCDLAMDHSRGGMIHSFSDRFKTRKRSLVAASSVGKWPLALTARRSLAFSASMAFVVYKIRRTSPGKA